MQECSDCGASARDVHSFCPECGESLSAESSSRHRGGDGGSSSGSADEGDGIGRRRLLMYGGAAVGTAAVAGGAGFLVLSSGGGGGDGAGSPEEAAREFYTALQNDNVEEAESMLHPDSPMQEIPPGMTGAASSGADLTLEETRVLEENDSFARVEIESAAETDSGVTMTANTTVSLRTSGGEWLVYPTTP